MTKKSLSSEFRDPDKADRLDELVQYLEYFDSLPETQAFKEHSYQYLGLKTGSVVLDAGCGPGYDSLRMAARVGSSGHVTGIDLSTGMVARAQEKAAGSGLPVSFRTGNICDLDLPDNSFDGVRVERTLQLVADTGRGIDELIRVLRPGGHWWQSIPTGRRLSSTRVTAIPPGNFSGSVRTSSLTARQAGNSTGTSVSGTSAMS